MAKILVTVSKEKALEHKFDKYPTKRLKYISKNGTKMEKRVAKRILRWESAGKKYRELRYKP